MTPRTARPRAALVDRAQHGVAVTVATVSRRESPEENVERIEEKVDA